MADQNKDQNTAPDFLGMSDEDIMNFNPASLASGPADTTAETTDENVDDEAQKAADAEAAAIQAKLDAQDEVNEDNGAENETEANKTADVDSGAATASGDADKAAADTEGKAADGKADAASTEKVEGDGEAKSGTEGAKDESVTIDYEAEYKKVFAPFKANGREIKVETIEDVQALMQMGANYNKKMQALKPNLKLMKMLEANGLLSEEKLSYLIDLDKKDPAAINKLVSESKMDPMDLSADKAEAYKPGNHAIDERVLQLDEVISEIEDSPKLTQTLQVVSSEWDQASRNIVVDNPELIKVVNKHMETGVYDRIKSTIDRERMLGRLKGLSDIDAYKQVGDDLQARGGFDDLFGRSKPVVKQQPAEKVVVAPKLKQAEEDKLKDQKRAVSSTKVVTSSKATVADFNPLSMSDEEFAKLKPI